MESVNQIDVKAVNRRTEIESEISNLTRQLKETTDDREYGRLWDRRLELKDKLITL